MYSATNYPDAKSPTSFEDGLTYQDFVQPYLFQHGIMVQYFRSAHSQLTTGESGQGVEIKLDNRCTDTHRLSIEVAEKTKADNLRYVSSGIYREDNTWLYVQGNYQIIYVFSKKLLVLLHRSRLYPEHQKPTIRTFYLPQSDAEKYAALIICPECRTSAPIVAPTRHER